MKPIRHRRRLAERRGRWAESLCVLCLRLSGWRILVRLLTAARGSGLGEVDIIARRGKAVAFIEVKARRDRDQGLAAALPRQQRRIAHAAGVLMERRSDLPACHVRFDVMVVGSSLIPHRLTDA